MTATKVLTLVLLSVLALMFFLALSGPKDPEGRPTQKVWLLAGLVACMYSVAILGDLWWP